MKKIESVNNEYIKKLAKLKEKKYRDLEGKFLVEGYHLVNEAKDYLQEVLIIKEEYKIELKVEQEFVNWKKDETKEEKN